MKSFIPKICMFFTGKPSLRSIIEDRDHRALFILLTEIAIVGAIIALILNPESAIGCMIWNGPTSRAVPDFSESIHITVHLRPYSVDLLNLKAVYPPLVYIALYPLKFVIPDIGEAVFVENIEIVLVFLFLFAAFALLYYLAVKRNTKLDKKTLLLLILFIGLSAPMIYCVERGNILFIALSLSAISLLTYENDKKTTLSIFCLALAINIKPYLAILALSYIFDKKYKEIAILAILSSLFFFIPMLFLGGLQEIPVFLSNMFNLESVNQGAGDFDFGYGFKIGLGNTVSLFAQVFGLNPNYYVLLIIKAILSVALLYSAKRARSQWERVSAFFLIFLIITDISWIYTALYFSIPLVMILNSEERSAKTMYFVLLLFLILVPLPYGFVISGLPGVNQINYSTLVCSISILLMSVSIIINNLKLPSRNSKHEHL